MGWKFDFGFCLEDNIGKHGITDEDIAGVEDALKASLDKLEKGRETGEPGFLKLPRVQMCGERCHEWAVEARERYNTFVLLGIGGSALGPRAIVDTLKHPLHNLLPDSQRIGMRIFICDNVDPGLLSSILDVVELDKTVFNVVSKSGGTAEAMAPFLIVKNHIQEQLGSELVREHIIFTTDPEKGELRKIAHEEDILAFEVPPNVGGRYSVLSSVGLLPAAAAGVAPEGLIEGAAWADDQCRTKDVRDNPAALLAALMYLFHKKKDKSIVVMMPYQNGLLTFAEWFQQLWAESLGKRKDVNGNDVFAGSTPVRALGATDQHSQLQLYMEGPRDKLVIFLRVEQPAIKMPIPGIYPNNDALSYLGDHTLGELLRAEQAATAAALAREGRPNMTLAVDRMDTQTMGALFHVFELATAIAGDLYRVNPYDQPGVELGKRLTYGMMGRKGFKPEKTEPDKPWTLRKEGP